jgi:hypothetical protein
MSPDLPASLATVSIDDAALRSKYVTPGLTLQSVTEKISTMVLRRRSPGALPSPALSGGSVLATPER